MGRPIPLLNAATATGRGAVAAITGDAVAVQAWISGGTATIVVRGSNDPRAASAPDQAAWDTLATFTLSGANDQAAIRDIVPFGYLTAEVSAVGGGAAVSAVLAEA